MLWRQRTRKYIEGETLPFGYWEGRYWCVCRRLPLPKYSSKMDNVHLNWDTAMASLSPLFWFFGQTTPSKPGKEAIVGSDVDGVDEVSGIWHYVTRTCQIKALQTTQSCKCVRNWANKIASNIWHSKIKICLFLPAKLVFTVTRLAPGSMQD